MALAWDGLLVLVVAQLTLQHLQPSAADNQQQELTLNACSEANACWPSRPNGSPMRSEPASRPGR